MKIYKKMCVREKTYFNPIRAGGGADSARTFFRWLLLHEKRGLEVRNFMAFPNSL